ncbi:MAG: hypothetical protein IPK79_01025 [Vampirovibrionales bacterium]|nr:hypothetical protein [Vampirovibrionales bacterium]
MTNDLDLRRAQYDLADERARANRLIGELAAIRAQLQASEATRHAGWDEVVRLKQCRCDACQCREAGKM